MLTATRYPSLYETSPDAVLEFATFYNLYQWLAASWCYGKKEAAGGWAPIKLKEGTTRASKNVEQVTAAVFDLDKKTTKTSSSVNKTEPITWDDINEIFE